jgi:hypothetical protein
MRVFPTRQLAHVSPSLSIRFMTQWQPDSPAAFNPFADVATRFDHRPAGTIKSDISQRHSKLAVTIDMSLWLMLASLNV